jgi:Family of unknown function (DUF6132)
MSGRCDWLGHQPAFLWNEFKAPHHLKQLIDMNFLLKHKLTILGIALGAVGGYIYYSQVGCLTGSCPITSRPLNSTLYGAMMGGLLLNMFQKEKPKAEQP